MREELARVLAYPQIAKRLDRTVPCPPIPCWRTLTAMRSCSPMRPKPLTPAKTPTTRKFIDLAVQHTAALHSKDAQVLCMKKRLERCGVALNPTTKTL